MHDANASAPDHSGVRPEAFDDDATAPETKTLRAAFLPFWIENPYQSRLSEELGKLGCEIVALSSSGMTVLRRVLSERPKVIHLHWLDPLYESKHPFASMLKLAGSIAFLWFLRATGTRFVWTAHNLTKHENKMRRLDRACTSAIVSLSHAVIAHCESAKSALIAEFTLGKPEKVHVIPHGNYCDIYQNTVSRTAARGQLGIAENQSVFLFLGRVRPYKGVLEMISAFRRHDAPDAVLLIAGKPLNEAAETEIRTAIGDDRRIHFHPGFVADRDVQIYMNACDAVVLPYQNVFTSGAAVLAMSFGRACIAPRLGCMVDWFEDDGALLYDAADTDGLYHSLRRALMPDARLEEMGARNERLARQWSWQTVAALTLDAYQG